MYTRGMNTFTFLDRDTIAATVPSALATTHDGLRSDRYRFVPTVEVIESMEANGWGVVKIRAPKARMQRSQAFGLHQVEFQDRNAVAIEDPRSRVQGRGIFPRIHIINSHNGASRFEVLAGMYAMVCSNGLMISTGSVGEFSVRHNAAFSVEEAHRVIAQFRSRMDAMRERNCAITLCASSTLKAALWRTLNSPTLPVEIIRPFEQTRAYIPARTSKRLAPLCELMMWMRGKMPRP